MAIKVGELLVEMAGDVARLRADMESGKRVVKSATDEIAHAANLAKTALGAIGVGISAGAVMGWVKSLIDGADQLNALAQRAGISARELAGLQYAIKQSGGDAEAMANGIRFLNKVLSEAASGHKTQADLFKALGITAGDAKGAVLQLAEVFPKLSAMDRTRVSMELFGRSGDQMIEMLAGGRDALADLIAEGERLNPQMDRMAAESDRFNDNVEKLATSLRGSLYPAISAVLEEFNELFEAVGGEEKSAAQRGFEITILGWSKAFNELLLPLEKATLKLAEFLGMTQRAATARAEIADIEAAIAGYEKRIEDLQVPGAVVGPARRRGGGAAPRLPRAAGSGAAEDDYAMDRMRANMREEERLIAEAYKKQKALQDELTKGQVDAAEEKVRQDFEDAEALAKFQMNALEERKKAEEKAAEESRRAWERQFDIISESLTDALMRGFEGGKDWAENFVDTLKNMFRTLVLRPVIQAIVAPVAGSITGLLGGLIPGIAGASSGIMPGESMGIPNGIGSLFNIFSNGGLGGWGGMAGAITGLGGSFFGGIGGALGNLGIEGFFAGMGGNLSAAMTAIGSGNIAGGIGTLIGTAMPIVGIGMALASLLGGFGSKGGPASYAGSMYYGQMSQARQGDPLTSGITATSRNSKEMFAWSMPDNWVGVDDLMTKQFMKLQDQMVKLAEQIGQTDARARLEARNYDFNVATEAQWGEGAEQDVVMKALRQISDQMALELLPNLEDFRQGTESLTETLVRVVGRAKEIEGALLNLPQTLGITQLEAFGSSLQMADFQAPLTRVATARSLLGETFQRAMAGDLSAVGAFPAMAQQLLGIGRDVFASGPQFAALFTEVNRMLQEVLGRQRDIQADILKDIDLSILEASRDQIAELKRGFQAMVDELLEIRKELRRQAA